MCWTEKTSVSTKTRDNTSRAYVGARCNSVLPDSNKQAWNGIDQRKEELEICRPGQKWQARFDRSGHEAMEIRL